ncbi:hypothetical protein [Yersinia phage MHG19]|nr:hypothetical protein [Yersinia phage MHG19]
MKHFELNSFYQFKNQEAIDAFKFEDRAEGDRHFADFVGLRPFQITEITPDSCTEDYEEGFDTGNEVTKIKLLGGSSLDVCTLESDDLDQAWLIDSREAKYFDLVFDASKYSTNTAYSMARDTLLAGDIDSLRSQLAHHREKAAELAKKIIEIEAAE